MAVKKLTAVIITLLAIVAVSTCVHGNEMFAPVVSVEENTVGGHIFSRIIEAEKKKAAGISLFSFESLDDVIDMKSVYVDDSNNVRALFFEYSGKEYTGNIEVGIDGNIFEVGGEPDSKGYVYRYFDAGEAVVSPQAVEIQFFRGSESSRKITEKPVKIVEGEADEWDVSDDGHTILAYFGKDNDVTVPNFYNNKIITSVEGYADDENWYNILEANENIESFERVTISDGIITVGNFAFYGMAELTDAVLPETAELIGGAVFADSGLTGDVVIPENIKEIYAYAFMNTDITGLTLNDNIERLCSYAFSDCTSLRGEIKLPDTLYYMGTGVFYECSGITGGITIPGSIEVIGDGAFFNCSGLDGELILEEGVKEIGTLAFGADGAKKINFTSVELPSTLKKIGPYAFQYCTGIKTISLPEGLEIISDGAFDHMSGLEDEKMIIPSTVHTIGGDYNVDENTGYGGHVFYDMGKNETFTEFEVAKDNKYFKAVDGVLYSKDMTRMLAYPRGKRDTVFEIPEGITQIDEMAFSRAYYLKKVILPDSYVITDDLPENILNQDANSLSGALYVYTSVNEIGVKDTNVNYTTVDGILYSKNMTCIYYIPNKYTGNVNIPEGVREIEKGCMFAPNKGNTNWNNIYIPSTMVYMDKNTVEFLNEYFKDYVIMENSIYYETDCDNTIQEVPYTYGDVNMDGNIDDKDNALTLKYISGILENGVLFNEKAANINMDSYVDLIDIILNFDNYTE